MLRMLLKILLVLGVSANTSAMAAEKYRIAAQIFRLGQIIAESYMVVEEGVTTSGSYSMEDGAQYKFLVLVRPAAANQLSVSMQYTSGNLTVQPNPLVDIDQQTEFVEDQTRIVFMIKREADLIAAKQTLEGTAWWVEDNHRKWKIGWEKKLVLYT